MAGVLIGSLAMGHFYIGLLLLALLTLMFRELLTLKRDTEREREIPNFFLISWYFYILTMVYAIPRYLPQEVQLSLFSDPLINDLHEYSQLSLYICFIVGILIFTLSLQKGSYKYQFKIFGWTLCVLVFVIAQVAAIFYNLFQGIFWFAFPFVLVQLNDTFAYLFGFFMG